ncbi:MAG: DpnD/PcfM family protein [Anaerovibrio sp.]|nr:DpnD/PcfM family protein [Anaerovibrio sp.]
MTKKYTVEIIETLCRQIEIEADTEDEAVELATEMYEAADIVLGAEDFVGFHIDAVSVE